MTVAGSLSAFAITLALGGGLVPASAQTAPAPVAAPAAPSDGGHGRMLDRMADRLHLTDAQKASCKAIFAKHQDSMATRRKAIADARKAFGDALQKPGTAPEALKGLHQALSDLEFDGLMERRALHQELRAVLNPDQREQAARMEGRMEGMRMARGGRWGQGPWGMKGGRSESAGTATAQ